MSIVRHRNVSGKPSPAPRPKSRRQPLPPEVRHGFMDVYSALLDLWAFAAGHARPAKMGELTLKAEGARSKLMALERSVHRMDRE